MQNYSMYERYSFFLFKSYSLLIMTVPPHVIFLEQNKNTMSYKVAER